MITDPTGWFTSQRRWCADFAEGETVMAQSGSCWLPRGVVGCLVSASADDASRRAELASILIAIKNDTSYRGVTMSDAGDTMVITNSTQASGWSTRLGSNDVHRLVDNGDLQNSLDSSTWSRKWKCVFEALNDNFPSEGWRLIVLDPLQHFVNGDVGTQANWDLALKRLGSLTRLGDGITILAAHDDLADIPGSGQANYCKWTATIESSYFKVRDGDYTSGLSDLAL